MKRFTVIMFVFAFVMTLTSTARADDWRRVDLQGTIAAVGDAGILLHTDRGEMRIHVSARTEITRNGERVRLHALQVRDQARVRAVMKRTRDGRYILAVQIRARGR